jgi:NADPH:quinone reductase-like Zn-dependent oxidoreductase
MASIMAAKAAGARVFATASSTERREIVKEMGAEQVFDSRTLNFVEEILALTDGRGADVIISSAPGK